MITEQEYKHALQAQKAAEHVIAEFHKQKNEDANARWERYDKQFEAYTDTDLVYAAGARCKKCNAGMAYPKQCPSNARQWTCSSVLKCEGTDKGHEALPFAFYEVKEEGQPSAHGATTRPKVVVEDAI